MPTRMVCDVQGTSNLAEWVCDDCGFGWVSSKVLECKVCGLETALSAAKARNAELEAEVKRLKRMREIDGVYIDRIQPCPDCRDKIIQGECERCKRQKFEVEVAQLEAERRRDALDGQAALDEANNEVARLRKALENISMQHLESEMEEEEDVDGADYRGAYDCIVKVARATLEASDESD